MVPPYWGPVTPAAGATDSGSAVAALVVVAAAVVVVVVVVVVEVDSVVLPVTVVAAVGVGAAAGVHDASTSAAIIRPPIINHAFLLVISHVLHYGCDFT